MPGELVVHGYSEDAKIPSTVARRLQLVDAIRPLPGKPGIWIVPVERMAFGLVREASAKGMTARAELESYVAEGLAECGDSVDTVVVRHLVDRCLAARLALQGVEPSVLGMKQTAASDAVLASAPCRRRQANAAKKRGRPTDTDPKEDERISEKWRRSGCSKYEEFARKENYPLRNVKNAVDRHRKREASRRTKSAPEMPSSLS